MYNKKLFSSDASNTGWGKRSFTAIHMENNIIINQSRINSVFWGLTTVNLRLPQPVLYFLFGCWFCRTVHFRKSSLHLWHVLLRTYVVSQYWKKCTPGYGYFSSIIYLHQRQKDFLNCFTLWSNLECWYC